MRTTATRTRRIGAASLALGLAGVLTANIITGTAAGAASAEVEEHLTEATKNAGADLDLINTYRTYSCDAVEDPTFYDRTSAERKATRVPLTRIFDNLWYIGSMYVGQYIYKTADGGFILIDSLNNSAEVDQYTMPALKSLGLGADHPLEAVLLSHGHGDHDGGASRLRELFGPELPIYLGSGDAGTKTYAPTPIDSADPEPQELTIGGSTMVLQSIPGHTPGALNFVVPARQGAKVSNLLMGGRQGHPRSADAAKGYLTGTERTYDLVSQYNVQGTFLTHPTSDGSTVNMQTIVRNGSRNPNPFIIGQERTLRAAAIWRGCAAAWLATVDPTTDVPVWKATSFELVQAKAGTNAISVRLLSGWGATDPDTGWGAVAGQKVTLTAGPNAGCTAVTNDEGLATCLTPYKLRPDQKITAAFEGVETADTRVLPANLTARVTARS